MSKADLYGNAQWLSKFQEVKISDLEGIPGTHHTGGARGPSKFHLKIAWKWAKCQKHSVEDQLLFGVRICDARVRWRLSPNNGKGEDAGDLVLGHSIEQNYTFDDMVTAFEDFLLAHPTEFVLLRLRIDSGAAIPNSGVEAMRARFQGTNCRVPIATEFNKDTLVKDLAGKIVIAHRNFQEAHENAIPETSIASMMDLCASWTTTGASNVRLRVENHLKAYHGLVQDELCGVALDAHFVPRPPSSTSPGLNRWFLKFVDNADYKIGMVVFDFVTAQDCDAVIKRNSRLIDQRKQEAHVTKIVAETETTPAFCIGNSNGSKKVVYLNAAAIDLDMMKEKELVLFACKDKEIKFEWSRKSQEKVKMGNGMERWEIEVDRVDKASGWGWEYWVQFVPNPAAEGVKPIKPICKESKKGCGYCCACCKCCGC